MNTLAEPTSLLVNGEVVSAADVVGRTVHLVATDRTTPFPGTPNRTFDKWMVRGYGSNRLVIDQRMYGVTYRNYIEIADLQPGSRIINDIPPAPTMTVRVGNRGQSRSYEGVWVTPVTIVATCPQCGGPRGEKYDGRIIEDGAYYHVHNWDNPCGHNDMYGAVLVEAGVHTPNHLKTQEG